MIQFGPEICADLEAGLEREWLETNGIGGFASSTVPGVNTRRYHGLLTAALHPPVGRYVLLSKLEETIFLNGAKFELSANLYPGTVNPRGYTHLVEFRLDPFPVFTYEAGGIRFEKRVFMVQGENTTVVEYQVLGDAPCTLEIRPLIAFRDYHSTTHANDSIDARIEMEPGCVSIRPYESLPRLYFCHNAQWTGKEGDWYYNFDYPRERERGLDSSEDLFQPLVLQFEIPAGGTAAVIVSTEARSASDAEALRLSEEARRAAVRASDMAYSDLTAAADQFIVRRSGDLHTVIAGYHWFSDWGRDTMIALPGLTLVTGRYDIARDILLAFSRAEDRGMIPNRFPDGNQGNDQPEYNTVDAALWYFEAIRQYVEYTGDLSFVRESLYPTMKSIIEWHLRGTRYGIHCGEDGLIEAGTPETQLTWMDAKIGAFVATPRNGKPVEIQALWYNALRFTASLAEQFNDQEFQAHLTEIAERAHRNFNSLFWNEEQGCLFDVVNGESRDPAIRPNQVIALALGHSMVSKDRALRILDVVERELVTPFGLRTLAPSDKHYCGRCSGGQVERDSSYHQGTVWPWLLGPFVTAAVRLRGRTGGWLDAFDAHLSTAGLGSISEIFDAEPPFAPRGCIAQAWSVAEILRASLANRI